MTLNEICNVIETPSHHFTDEGKVALVKIDMLSKHIVDTLGKDFAKETVNVLGQGFEYEFFCLLENYIKKDHI